MNNEFYEAYFQQKFTADVHGK